MSNVHPDIMTIGETVEYLRVSLYSLYKYMQEGKIPGQKVGRHWRSRREAIERWLEEKQKANRLKDQRTENEKLLDSKNNYGNI